MRVSKNKIYNMGKKQANETLMNVFAACNQAPNTRSFDYLVVKNIANTTIVKVGKRMAIVLLMLVILSPLAFRNSNGYQQINRKNPVVVVSHHLDKGNACFVMELRGMGIDYSGIYAKTETGQIVVPSDTDEETGLVTIPFTEGNLNIFIPNEDGSVIQAVLSK